MSVPEFYIRQLRCRKLYHLAICLGNELLKVYPKSNILKEELALSYYWSGCNNPENLRKGNQILNEIRMSRHSDLDLFNRVEFNKNFFMKALDSIQNINPDIFEPHFTNPVVLCKLPLVTFSITSSRRLDLFVKTINSFLRNCLDHHLIYRWICVDDNSSEDDRRVMKELFPFFEFIWKTPEEKGHPESMKMISNLIKTPYFIHIEDDRMLVDQRHYIKDMLNILEHDKTIGQVGFNHNYMETIDDDIKGGILQKTKDGVFYYIHEYCPNETTKNEFNQKYGQCKSCNYYPHFTLSPSMIRTAIFNKVGFYNEKSFEFQFAKRYVSVGYKTSFLPGFHIKHIGRLTSEIYDMDKYNAYDLLDTKQFQEKTRYKSFILNLDRRPDRLEKIKQQKNYLPENLEYVSACDGTKLKINSRLRSLCRRKGDYFMRPGVIGCALSHIKLYEQLLYNELEEIDGYVIFEDDVVADENFNYRMKRIFTIMENKGENPDIIFFTTVPKGYNNHNYSERGIIRKTTLDHIIKDSVGGTGCYYISKRGAKAALDYIEQNTLNVPIDVVLFYLAPKIVILFVQPPIITQYEENTISDVQADYNVRSPLYEDVVNETDYSRDIIYNSDGKMDLFENLEWNHCQNA